VNRVQDGRVRSRRTMLPGAAMHARKTSRRIAHAVDMPIRR
jgi:hypothetical protein